ncbi:MAG: hypothetical protein AB9919_01695 [Geobacteraceae bacterium]
MSLKLNCLPQDSYHNHHDMLYDGRDTRALAGGALMLTGFALIILFG